MVFNCKLIGEVPDNVNKEKNKVVYPLHSKDGPVTPVGNTGHSFLFSMFCRCLVATVCLI